MLTDKLRVCVCVGGVHVITIKEKGHEFEKVRWGQHGRDWRKEREGVNNAIIF